MLTALLIAPVVAAAAAAVVRSERWRPLVLPALGVAHLGLTVGAIATRTRITGANTLQSGLWLRLDAAGSVVLLSLSVLFLLVACYAPAYLRIRSERPNRVIVVCTCLFLCFASLATASQHLGVMWASIEAATLSVTPMIYFNNNPRSLEATWKYLMVGGTGIALALLGTFFLAYSAIAAGDQPSMTYVDLTASVKSFSPAWLRTAFVLLFVGYGTKMGLAPMHTWKPDTYGETPGMVAALMAGGMTSVAFLALMRVVGVMDAAGLGDFARSLLVFMGLLSMVWAAAFMVRQTDLKRMLAYSSVEHMGILIVGLGLGPVALPLVLLHVIGNAIAKASVFLSVGNIRRVFATGSVPGLSGAIRRVPVSAILLLLGFLAATGSPPFSLFLSEFGMVRVAMVSGQWWTAGVFLLALALVFVGFSQTLLQAIFGEPPKDDAPVFRDTWRTTAVPAVGLALVLVLGLWIPTPLQALFTEAQASAQQRSGLTAIPAADASQGQVAP